MAIDLRQFITPSSINVDDGNLFSGNKLDPEGIQKVADSRRFVGDMNFSPIDYDTTNMIKDEIPIVQGLEDKEIEKIKSEQQGAMTKLGHAIAQTVVGEVGLGTAIGIADLFDIVSGEVFRSDNDYQNPASKYLTEVKENFNNNIVPIYKDPNKTILNGGLADFGWWMSNIPSVASSLTLLLPSTGVVKGIQYGTKALKLGKLVTKTGDLISKTKKGERILKGAKSALALDTAEGLSIAGRRLEQGLTAVASRTMENYQEARGVYDEVYNNALEAINEMSEEQYNKMIVNNHLENIANDKDAVARKIAGDSADKDFLWNYTNTVFDYLQIRALKNMWRGQINRPTTFGQRMANENALDELVKIGKNADELAKIVDVTNRASKLARGLKHGIGGFNTVAFAQFSEGIEEGINYISEQEGITYGNQLLGKEIDNGFDTRLKDYLKNGQLYDSMFWGWLGGILFEGVGSQLGRAKEKIQNKLSKSNINGKLYSEDKVRLNEINGRFSKVENFINQMNKINDGLDIYNFDEETKTYGTFSDNETYRKQEQQIAREKLTREFVTDLALNSAQNGNLGLLKTYLQDDRLTQALIDNKVIDENRANDFSNEAMSIIDNINHKYNQQLDILNATGISVEAAQILATENIQHQLNIDNLQTDLTNNQANLQERLNGHSSDYLNNNAAYRQNKIDAVVYAEKLKVLREEKKRLEHKGTISSEIGLREVNRQISILEKTISNNPYFDQIMYQSLMIRQFDTETGNFKDKTVDTNEAFAYRDKYIESNYDRISDNGTPIKDPLVITARKDKAKVDFDQKLDDAMTEFTKVQAIDPEIAEMYAANAIYQAEIDSERGAIITEKETAKEKEKYLNEWMDKATRNAIDNSVNEVQKIMKIYGGKKIIDYINEGTEIENISESDKKKLDDNIVLLDLKNRSANVLNQLLQNAAIIDAEIAKNQQNPAPAEDLSSTNSQQSQNNALQSTQNLSPNNSSAQPQQSTTTQGKGQSGGSTQQSQQDIEGQKMVNRNINVKAAAIARKHRSDIITSSDINDLVNEYTQELMQDPDVNVAEDEARKTIKSKIEMIKNLSTSMASAILDVYATSDPYAEVYSKEFKQAVETLVDLFYKENNLTKKKGKPYYISLESLLRYAKQHGADVGITNDLIEALKNYLIDESQKGNEELINAKRKNIYKYKLTDNFSNLTEEKLIDRSNKTVEEILKEEVARGNYHRVNIYDTFYDEAGNKTGIINQSFVQKLNSLNPGDKLDAKKIDTRIVLSINGNNVGSLTIPIVESNGTLAVVNQGWHTDVLATSQGINSRFRDYLVNLYINNNLSQVTDPSTGVSIDLMDILNEYTYQNPTPARRLELESLFAQTQEIINARAMNILKTNDNYVALSHLSNLHQYLSSAGVTTYERLASINSWVEKLYNSYNTILSIAKDPSNKEIIVSKLSEGELIQVDPKDAEKPSKAIANLDTEKIKIAVTPSPGVIFSSGGDKYTFSSAIRGRTWVVLPNRSGSPSYVHAYPARLNDSNIGQEAKDIINAIKVKLVNLIADRSKKDEDSYRELVNFITGVLSKDSSSSSLFSKKQGDLNKTNLYISNVGNEFIIIQAGDIKLTVHKKSQDQSLYSTKVTINRKGSNPVIVDCKSAEVKTAVDEIFDNISFKFEEAFITTDGQVNSTFRQNSIVSRDSNGFHITVDNKTWTYKDFNEFILNNDLCNVTTKIENGSNFRTLGTETNVRQRQKLEVVISDKATPVEESTNTTTIEVNGNKEKVKTIQAIIASRSTTKGKKIVETIIPNLKQLGLDILTDKNLDLFPRKIIFVSDLNGDYCQALPDKTVRVSQKWLDLVETRPTEAIAKLIHEQIHNKLNGNKEVLENIREIYKEFQNSLSNKDEADRIIKEFVNPNYDSTFLKQFLPEFYKNKFEKNYPGKEFNEDRALEEFFVESITNRGLIQYLNNVQSSTSENGKESIWQSIINALLKLFNFNINKGSLLEKEFNVLAEEIEKVKQEETTESEETVESEETSIADVNEEDDPFDSSIVDPYEVSRTVSGFIDSFPLNQQVAISNMIDNGNINISCKF